MRGAAAPPAVVVPPDRLAFTTRGTLSIIPRGCAILSTATAALAGAAIPPTAAATATPIDVIPPNRLVTSAAASGIHGAEFAALGVRRAVPPGRADEPLSGEDVGLQVDRASRAAAMFSDSTECALRISSSSSSL